MIKFMFSLLLLSLSVSTAFASPCDQFYPHNKEIVVKDTKVLCKNFYAVVWDQKHVANVFSTEAVQPDTRVPRKDAFRPDPQLMEETSIKEDYVGSGLDRGHNMPAAENQCQTPAVQDECFYFSNMTPQYHSLNAGDWKSVEVLERQLSMTNDSVHVWCGSVGVAKIIGANKVAVPTQCWKVIYIVKTKEYMAFIFDNNTNKPTGVNSHKVEVSDVEKLSGYKFK